MSPRGQKDTASSGGQSRRPSEGPREDWLRKAADAREKDCKCNFSGVSRVMQQGHVLGQLSA